MRDAGKYKGDEQRDKRACDLNTHVNQSQSKARQKEENARSAATRYRLIAAVVALRFRCCQLECLGEIGGVPLRQFDRPPLRMNGALPLRAGELRQNVLFSRSDRANSATCINC